jgi:hypothetical protein
MADATAEIARSIDDERRNLDQNLSELTARAAAAVDWREHVRQRPALMLAAALGGGLVLALMSGRGRRRGLWPPRTTVAGGPLESIVGALFATATAAVVTMLSDAVPGFLEEHRKRRAVPSPNLVVPVRDTVRR